MMPMSTIAVTKSNIESKVLTSEKTIVLEFWAKWSESCKAVSPILEELANECPNILVGKVNVDYEPELARAYGIVSLPTLVVIKDGKVTNKIVGSQSKDDLIDLLS